ncbi:MAG: PKD domain-containing protein, partial [Nanoarchaeota archaeon]|nr:PKD domain-containing protein [Nanoarchaeota archaeon]
MEKRGTKLMYFSLFSVLLLALFSFFVSADALVADAYANATSGNVPFAVQFLGTATGGNGTPTYAWDLNGDGTYETSGQNPTYTYTTGGTYAVKLNVTDAVGNSSTDSLTITAQQANPSITISKTLISTNNRVDGKISFRITVTNNGDVQLHDISVADTFNNDYLDFHSTNVSGYSETSQKVQWNNLGTLDVGKSINIAINFTGEDDGTVTNYANVTAKDTYNTTVSASSSASVTILVDDTTAPTVILDSPADEYYTDADELIFRWNVTDNLDDELVCNLTIDDEVVREDVDVDNNTRKSKTEAVETGNHTWEVSCWDDNNNVGNSSTRTFYVNMNQTPEPAYDFDLDELLSVTEYMNQSSSISLRINDEDYIITLVEVYASSVQIEIPTIGESYFIQQDKSIAIDLDLDDTLDLSISLLSLSSSRNARLKFTKMLNITAANLTNNTNATVNDTLNESDENETSLLNATDENVTESGTDATGAAVAAGPTTDELIDELIAAREKARQEGNNSSFFYKSIDTVKKYPWYFAAAILLVVVLIYGASVLSRRPGDHITGPSLPNPLVSYVENALKDGVYKGEIHSSLIKAGWSESEVNRALLFARMKSDIKSGMEADFIRADLVAQGWNPEEIREAFTYFNVKLNLEKNIPLDKIQAALVERGVPHHQINRAVLYNKVMKVESDQKELPESELKQMLYKKGWSKDNVKRALFYAYVKNKLNEGIAIGKIEEGLLKEGKDRGEIKQMIRSL